MRITGFNLAVNRNRPGTFRDAVRFFAGRECDTESGGKES